MTEHSSTLRKLPLFGKWGSELKDYAIITLGVFLYAIGVTVFMLPYGLTTGGVAGAASIIYYVTGVEVQVTYIIVNILLKQREYCSQAVRIVFKGSEDSLRGQ